MRETEADVLLAEDEPIVCRAVERILTSRGLRVETATTCPVASDRLRATAYKVLLCDLMLPGGSGFDLLAEARAGQPDLQAVLITGFATVDNAVRAFHRGAFDYLPKPFDLNELFGVVERALHYRKRLLDSPDEEPAGAPELLRLGRHSWARVDGARSATLGPAETFRDCIDALVEIELPEIGSHIVQGQRLARLRSADDGIHRIRAPLSGTVLEVHAALHRNPAAVSEDPFGEGWLVRIVPLPEEAGALPADESGPRFDRGPSAD